MSNGDAALARRFAAGPPVVRGVTDRRTGALDVGDSAGIGADALAAARGALALFAAPLLRALAEDPAFGDTGFLAGGLDGLRVVARFFAGPDFLPLSLSGTGSFRLGADRFFSDIRTMLTLPRRKCQGCHSARVPQCQGAQVPKCQSAKVRGAGMTVAASAPFH